MIRLLLRRALGALLGILVVLLLPLALATATMCDAYLRLSEIAAGLIHKRA